METTDFLDEDIDFLEEDEDLQEFLEYMAFRRRQTTIAVAAAVILLITVLVCFFAFRRPKNYIGHVSARHTITLKGVDAAGTYTLRYANAKGALSDYAPICTLEVTNPVSAVSYDDLIDENCAPAEATQIAVYDASNNKVGVIALGSLKADLGKKLYSFGAISDVHIGYETAEDDFKNALNYLCDTERVAFIGIAGDLTGSATDQQFETYRDIVSANATVPVYAITGNHDTESYRGSDVPDIISNYTNQPLYYSFTHGKDVYIMLGTKLQEVGNHLADGELQWLAEALEENKDKRCFIFTHVYLNNSSGDPGNIYDFDLWSGAEEQVFLDLLADYPNATIFHGHSHVEFALQAMDDLTNVHIGAEYNSIHIPSITAPRTGTLDGNSILSNYLYEKSEGYVVDVYANGIVLRGRDFASGEFLPIAQYYIPTSGQRSDSGDSGAAVGDISVTYDLPNTTSSNPVSDLVSGSTFETTITAEWGYEIDEIRVTMDGNDITAYAVTGTSIRIPEVTGNITISASSHYITINLVDAVGYQNDFRISNQTGELKEHLNFAATDGLIQLEPGAVYRVTGLDFNTSDGYSVISLYHNTSKFWAPAILGPTLTYPFNFPNDSTPVLNIDRTKYGDLVITAATDLFNNGDLYFRVAGYGSGENLFITKNQELPEIASKQSLGSIGYQDNVRISQTTGKLKAQDGYAATIDYIPLEPGAVYKINGLDFAKSKDHCMMMIYDNAREKKAIVTFGPDVVYPYNYPSDALPMLHIDRDKQGTLIITVSEDLLSNQKMRNCSYFRLCGYGSGKNLVITME